jgi:hypothetical protein
MNQFILQPYLVYEAMRYQEDIIKKVHQYQLIAELRKISNGKTRRESKTLAFIGKELAVLGTRLEARYGKPAENNPALIQQSNPGGCA